MHSSEKTASWSELLAEGNVMLLALLCFSIWLHAAQSMLVATMVPAMVEDIGGVQFIAWLFALYEAGSIVAGICCGVLSMRFGLKLPMVCAALGFAVGSMVNAAAPNMVIVLFGRLLQGLGGGALIATAFISVSLLFSRRLMPRALAAMSVVWGVSAFIGPLIGGVFVEYSTWRNGFLFFSVGAIVLAVWIYATFDERTLDRPKDLNKRVPLNRLILLCVGILSFAAGGIYVSIWLTPISIVFSLSCLYGFIRLDSRREETRLLPQEPLKMSNPVSAGLAMIFCFTMATIAITTYGPYLIIKLHGASALSAGLVVVCASIGWSLAAVPVSGMAEKHDPRMIHTGMLILLASIIGFVIFFNSGNLWLIAACALAEGAGFGICWTFILRRATALCRQADRERVAGAITPIQRAGYALGAAYLGIIANGIGIQNATSRVELENIATTIFLGCVPLALLGYIAGRRFIKSG